MQLLPTTSYAPPSIILFSAPLRSLMFFYKTLMTILQVMPEALFFFSLSIYFVQDVDAVCFTQGKLIIIVHQSFLHCQGAALHIYSLSKIAIL